MNEILTPSKLKDALIRLGHYMLQPDEQLAELIRTAHYHNAWFTPAETAKAIKAIGNMLNEADLEKWLEHAVQRAEFTPKRIGLVLAGNIPAVGFHDILCVLSSGHQALIKLSSQDERLIPHLLEKLTEFEPGLRSSFLFTERLEKFDAVIATGSTNSSRYFEYYFGKVPHIIRKNRTSAAILTSDEHAVHFQALGNDIFDYFGLGCRNVSKLYVPQGYNFNNFFEGIESFKPAGDHHKFNNNYDYNKSIYLVNGDKHFDNGFLLVKEDERLTSPLAVLYYEEYDNPGSLEIKLEKVAEQLQCLVTNIPVNVSVSQVGFGKSQDPKLWDYADGIDTLAFLNGITGKP